MCCLFGFMDYKGTLTTRQKTRLTTELSVAAEERGTDATGIAYLSGPSLHIYKRPLPAHQMRFILPHDTNVVMGHTRMTTQGNAKHNYNNHPFEAVAGGRHFSLAHNGVIFNDETLRRAHNLPETKIETDSYICVQLIQERHTLDPSTLAYMAERLLGSFTITVLDEQGSLYIIRGDNPMCLYHYPKRGLYIYASTEQILKKALRHIGFLGEAPVNVSPVAGDILKLSSSGKPSWFKFDDSNVNYNVLYYPWRYGDYAVDDEYVDQLKAVAGAYGYTPQNIDQFLKDGLTPEEIEEYLYG